MLEGKFRRLTVGELKLSSPVRISGYGECFCDAVCRRTAEEFPVRVTVKVKSFVWSPRLPETVLLTVRLPSL